LCFSLYAEELIETTQALQQLDADRKKTKQTIRDKKTAEEAEKKKTDTLPVPAQSSTTIPQDASCEYIIYIFYVYTII
jgi:hypothetical protein